MNRTTIARAHARATARVAIAAAVLVGCVLADCAVLAYELGRQTGAAVHARNEQLAALARRLATGAPEPAEPEPSIAAVFAAAAAELAASDARVYRPVARHGANVRAILAEAERPEPTYERVITAWLAVDAGSETVISEHETEAEARAACASYRKSHPGRCPRLQERIEWRLVSATTAHHHPDLTRLTVRQLRDLTGARSKRLRKADLVAMAEAMAA